MNKSDMVHDHTMEIKNNDQLIAGHRRNIDIMERSIRMLEIENQGHRYQIDSLKRPIE